MKVEVFTLCDAATDQHGKLNILGCFDLICGSVVPAVHPACTVAIRIRFSQMEQGPHSLRLVLTNDDGQAVFPPMNTQMMVILPPEAVSLSQNFIFNMQALQFPKFGDYSFNLYFDNKLVDSLPIYLRQTPKHLGGHPPKS